MSPTYAEEMQRPEYGNAMDGVIRSRRDALVGILNGIDHDEWNPLADPFLPAPFDADSLDGKAAAKRALLEAFGFTITGDLLARPVIGMVSRMVDQKGLDLVAAAARDLMSLDATFVIVGTGEPRYQEMWTALARMRPDRSGVFIEFESLDTIEEQIKEILTRVESRKQLRNELYDLSIEQPILPHDPQLSRPPKAASLPLYFEQALRRFSGPSHD